MEGEARSDQRGAARPEAPAEARAEPRQIPGRYGDGEGDPYRPRREGLRCFRCGRPGHLRRECPIRMGPREAAWMRNQVREAKTQTVVVRVNGRRGLALVDSGCTQTLVRGGWVRPHCLNKTMWIRCIHGDVKGYKAGHAKLEVAGHSRWMEVGIAPNLPYEVIVGRDWPFFASLVSRGLDSSCAGEQLQGPAGLGIEQKEDPTLKEAWKAAEGGGAPSAWVLG